MAALAVCVPAFLSGCKTKPPEPENPAPGVSLKFDSVEAADPTMVDLDFILDVKNLRPEAAELTIENWNVEVNGVETVNGLTLLPGGSSFELFPSGEEGAADEESSLEIPVRVKIDLSLLPPDFLKRDDMEIELELGLLFTYESGDTVRSLAAENAVFPIIREPVFSITEIAVLKAELINTRFRVNLKVENPNPFPVELSSFVYELYGDGRFWADGGERDVFIIPGRESKEAQLFLIMNFINMKRPLLDQIIRLEDVRYRFNGEVTVSTGVDYLPSFVSPFDLSGFSRVLER